VLDAAGFDRILIETVGVGQSELEVAQTADSTAVVLVPESGDAVQAMKAGLMEIADLFVINKSDREGADRAAQAIRSALHLRARGSEWTIPVMLTAASLGRGVPELVQAFERHLAWLTETGTLEGRRRQRLEQTLEVLVRERLWEDFRSQVPEGAWREALATLAERRETPNRLSERLVRGTRGTRQRPGHRAHRRRRIPLIDDPSGAILPAPPRSTDSIREVHRAGRQPSSPLPRARVRPHVDGARAAHASGARRLERGPGRGARDERALPCGLRDRRFALRRHRRVAGEHRERRPAQGTARARER
jgi:hypothetical protein